MGNCSRRQPQGTLYGELKTPVTEDVLQVGLLFAFGIIAFSFILIIPGIRGWEVRNNNILSLLAVYFETAVKFTNIMQSYFCREFGQHFVYS